MLLLIHIFIEIIYYENGTKSLNFSSATFMFVDLSAQWHAVLVPREDRACGGDHLTLKASVLTTPNTRHPRRALARPQHFVPLFLAHRLTPLCR